MQGEIRVKHETQGILGTVLEFGFMDNGNGRAIIAWDAQPGQPKRIQGEATSVLQLVSITPGTSEASAPWEQILSTLNAIAQGTQRIGGQTAPWDQIVAGLAAITTAIGQGGAGGGGGGGGEPPPEPPVPARFQLRAHYASSPPDSPGSLFGPFTKNEDAVKCVLVLAARSDVLGVKVEPVIEEAP